MEKLDQTNRNFRKKRVVSLLLYLHAQARKKFFWTSL